MNICCSSITLRLKQGSTFGTENDASKDFSFYSPAVVLDYNCSGTDWDNAAKIKLPYSFTVTSLTDDAATLTLTKLA
jgi:CRP-like cAMP-binding protein